jgi:DNA-binding beta-propeller fold protein YncE
MDRRRLFNVLGAACVAAMPACVSPGEGPSPDTGAMYYPVGLSVSPGGHTLYVANSDFDLQYNGGTVLALDLDRIRDLIPPVWDATASDTPCGSLAPNNQSILYPGPCSPISIKAPPDGRGSLVSAAAEIGAFGTDIITVARNDAPGVRLFVPVRGDPSITWFDVEDDRGLEAPFERHLSCGKPSATGRCDAQHRAGEDPDTNLRRVVLPPEPYGIAATEDGEALIVTHQTSGSISLLTNAWDGAPTLQFVSSGFPAGGVGAAALPIPRYVTVKGLDYQPGFLATFRAAAEVDLVRYYDDAAAAPSRPFIVRAGAARINVNASGVDSRGIAIDASERKACETTCNDDEACLQTCAAIPANVYVVNRAPPSLLLGRTRATVSPTGSDDLVEIYDTVPLTFGASRVVFGSVINPEGRPEPRVFVSCFDARYIFLYDPVGRRFDGQIRTGRGPHAMALDPVAPYLYVAHFTDSYVGVVDLDQRHALTYPSIVATVGVPTPPRESK